MRFLRFVLIVLSGRFLSPGRLVRFISTCQLHPSCERPGREEDRVTVHDIRNFDYRSATDFTPRYDTRTFDLAGDAPDFSQRIRAGLAGF